MCLPNENFEYGYPHSNALLQFRLESEDWQPHKDARYLTKCDLLNDVKMFPTVYRRIYCRISMLSNQMLRYKSQCIRISFFISWWGNVVYKYYVDKLTARNPLNFN